jgi:hypothetical protein
MAHNPVLKETILVITYIRGIYRLEYHFLSSEALAAILKICDVKSVVT